MRNVSSRTAQGQREPVAHIEVPQLCWGHAYRATPQGSQARSGDQALLCSDEENPPYPHTSGVTTGPRSGSLC